MSSIEVKQAQADLPAVLRLRGMAQLQSGDYASAVFTLTKLTEAQPDNIEGWFQLARAHAAAGDNANQDGYLDGDTIANTMPTRGMDADDLMHRERLAALASCLRADLMSPVRAGAGAKPVFDLFRYGPMMWLQEQAALVDEALTVLRPKKAPRIALPKEIMVSTLRDLACSCSRS